MCRCGAKLRRNWRHHLIGRIVGIALPAVWLALPAGSLAAQQPPSRATQPASAPSDAALDVRLEEIDARGARIKDFAATFRQEKVTSLLKEPLISTGTVRVTGATVRWDTQHPEPAVLYSDGREVKMYYPRQAALEVYPIDQRIGDLASSPLPRLEALRRHFKIREIPLKDFSDGNDDTRQIALRLEPSEESLKEHVDCVNVLLDVRGAYILKLETIDADGDRTVVRFQDVKLNAGMKEAELALFLPPGIKVTRPLEGASGGSEHGTGKNRSESRSR